MKKIVSSLLVAGFLFAGCQQTTKQQNQNVEVTGVRKAPLTESSQNLPVVTYNETAPVPGKIKPQKAAFLGAPPMIPHSVEGMVPITKNNNMCLNCHIPQNAHALNVTPMPNDHMNKNRVDGRHYNCTLCHAPQANLDPVIQNKFESLKK